MNVEIIFYSRSQWRYSSTARLLCNLLSASGQGEDRGATQWQAEWLESGFKKTKIVSNACERFVYTWRNYYQAVELR